MFAHGLRAGGEAGQHMLTFASFLQHAWNPERGCFRNFMGSDRRWPEQAGSAQSNARTPWALGHSAAKASGADFRRWAAGRSPRATPPAKVLKRPPAIASALSGAANISASPPR